MNLLPPDLFRQHKGISFVGVAVCFFCHDGNGEMFFGKRSQNTRDERGRWDSGGGGLKFGESVEEALHRELKEEYNADPLKQQWLGYRDVFRTNNDGTPTHWLSLDFAVLVDRDQVKIMEPDMFEDSGWFRLDALPEPLHSQQVKALTQHKEALDGIMNRGA